MKSRTIPFPSFCPCSSDKEADLAAGRFFRPGPSMKKNRGNSSIKSKKPSLFILFIRISTTRKMDMSGKRTEHSAVRSHSWRTQYTPSLYKPPRPAGLFFSGNLTIRSSPTFSHLRQTENGRLPARMPETAASSVGMTPSGLPAQDASGLTVPPPLRAKLSGRLLCRTADPVQRHKGKSEC